MIHRTWEYGTVKRVEVISVEKSRVGPSEIAIVAVVERDVGDPEGFILVRGIPAGGLPIKGDWGRIEFKAGGPTGGFWGYRGDNGKVF